MIGGIIILSAAFKIYWDIFNEKVIAATVEYPKQNVGVYKVPFLDFYKTTNLNFEIIAKDFWNDTTEYATCE